MAQLKSSGQARLTQINRFPVKGLAGERLQAVTLEAGRALPHDRRYALALGGGAGGDLDGGAWADYRLFHTLKQEEKLAQLGLSYDEAAETLTLLRGGKPVARGKATDPVGRSLLNQFFAAFLAGSPRGAPRLVAGRRDAESAVAFTDAEVPYLSLLNLATVADLERVARQPVDPRRFRANLWIEGPPAWAEMAWAGRRMTLGEAVLEGAEPIERCAATTVNPDTAQRDLNVPRLLQAGFGHIFCGFYLRVVEGGRIAEGDELVVTD
ncbi:MAG TPA: MOSC domain-containing protein [Kiloniellales bacterium]|nr:MOSC domain-containing protein [Kiloniellales bacterium]